MDYTEKYELDTKAGNRLGRRLRTLGGSIGKRVGRGVGSVEAYDPNAYDGDEDGLVQDGTPWERPANIVAHVAPSIITAQAEALGVREETRTTAPDDDRRRRRGSLRSSGDDAPPREVVPDEDTPEAQDDAALVQSQEVGASVTGGVTGAPTPPRDREKELKQKDHRITGSTADMSPEELADLALRPPSDETDLHAADSMVGHPDDYESEAAYNKAKEAALHMIKLRMNNREAYDAIRERYDAKYGTGAFDDDAHRNREQLADRTKELIGDAMVHMLLLGTPDTDGRKEQFSDDLKDVSQRRFLEAMVNDPNVPSWKRDVYRAILATKRESKLFTTADRNNPPVMRRPTLNYIPAFFSNIFAPDKIIEHTNPQGLFHYHELRGDTHQLNEVVARPWNSEDMTAAQIMVMVVNDYYDFAARQPSMTSKQITRDGKDGNLPSPEQVEARFYLAAKQPSVQQAILLAFPGETVYHPDLNNRMLPARVFQINEVEENPITYQHAKMTIQHFKPHTSDPETLGIARAIVADFLRNNPQALALWREFGVPSIRIIHPLVSSDYLDLPNGVQLTESLITDNSTDGKRRRSNLLAALKDSFIAMNGIFAQDKALKRQGRARETPKILRKLFGRRADEIITGTLPNRMMRRNQEGAITRLYDRANDPSMAFGGSDTENIGGSYFTGTGILEIDIMSLVYGTLEPIKADEGIVDTGNGYSSMVGMGGGATIFHEWVHWYNEMAKGEVIRILEPRLAQFFQQNYNYLISQGYSDADARRQIKRAVENLIKEHGAGPGGSGDWGKFWNAAWTQFDPTRPELTTSELPRHRKIINFDDYAKYGYASKEEMEDDFLLTFFRLQNDGYGQGEILESLHQKSGADPSTLTERRRIAAAAAKTVDQPYVRTSYGQSLPQERIAEGAIGAFLSQFRNLPFMNNDTMIRLLNTFFMRRDAQGPLEEPHGIVSFRRRKKNKSRNVTWRDEYLTDTQSMDATSTIRTILPEERRGPDGQRGTLRSAGRVSAVNSRSMRFDPDERSRLRSGSSNIGLDTDERLYAFETPIAVSDFRARSRTLIIGDYHFYDDGVPYAQRATTRYRAEVGFLAGRVFVNRNRPHDGDMMRAMSATQFGMFVDDMPTYATTSESDRGMLRGFVTGKIMDLPQPSRARIERALKNVTHVHSAVQLAKPNRNELYRLVKADPRSFVEGLEIGERIPMPITAFSRARPSVDAGDVVIRIQRGAKAIDVQDGQFITQGTFEVVALDIVDGQVTATLKHVETYDPRHDAMRPVDRFSDKPGAMRKFGTPRPRYTRQEQQLMETDLARRMDMAQVGKQIAGLRSSGTITSESFFGPSADAEIEKLIGTQSERRKASENIVAALKAKVRQAIQNQVDRRLDKAREVLREKYGDSKPWIQDAEALNKFVSSDTDQRDAVLQSIFARISDRISATFENGDRTDDVQWVEGSILAERGVVADYFLKGDMSLSRKQLDILIDRGELAVPLNRVPVRYKGSPVRTNKLRQGDLIASVSIALTDEERDVLKTIRDVIAVGERAYMLDSKDGQTFTSNGTEFTVSDTLTLDDSVFGDAIYMFKPSFGPTEFAEKFFFNGIVRRGDIYVGNFRRTVTPTRDGRFSIYHSNMDMSGAGGGVATILNQHAWQWWKQIPKTEVRLTAVDDGRFVWARHGFNAEPADPEILNTSDVAYGQLIKAVQFIIAATSPDRKTRESTYPPKKEFEKLIAARIDRSGNTLYTQLGQEDGDRQMRERLALWLALSVEDEQRPDQPRRANLVLLANLLDSSAMSKPQREAWKELFTTSHDGRFRIQLDGSSGEDDDYLPSFVVSDEDPIGALVARQIAISEARNEGDAMDMLLPVSSNQDARIADGDSIDAGEVVARVSRLSTLFMDQGKEYKANLTSQALLAREISGGEGLPKLFDAGTFQALFREEVRLKTRPLILVGIGQDSKRRNIREQIVEAAGNFLRGNRGRRWDNEDKRFDTDFIFTTTPGEYVERFADPDDPSIDPATNSVGLLGMAKENAKVITNADVDKIKTDAGKALKKLQNIAGTDLQNLDKFTFRGKPIYVKAKDRQTGKDVFVLDDEIFFKFLDSNLPNADKSAMRAIFGSFADHVTMLRGAANSEDTDKLKAQLKWLSNLLTDGGFASDEQRTRQTVATLLGYDFLDETGVGHTRTRIAVLNRGALIMVDEPVSLAYINNLTGATVTPMNPRSLRSSGIATTMMLGDDGEPTLLRMNDPLELTPRRLESRSYSRLLKQDYGINPPATSLRSSSNFDLENRLKAWRNGREDARLPNPMLPGSSKGDFTLELSERVRGYNRLSAKIEQIDDQIMELESRYMDLDVAGELTPELDASINEQIDQLSDSKTETEMQMKDFSDSIAQYIATVNAYIEMSEREQGLIFALEKFLNDPAMREIPEDYRTKLTEFLAELRERATPTSEILFRQKLLQDLLDDQFDIRSEMDDIEVVLEVFEEDPEFHADGALEDIYRAFFDPDYETWRQGQDDRYLFSRPNLSEDEIRFRDLVKDITREERQTWGARHDNRLREEYNAQYEEALIDATPSQPSRVPKGVPLKVWRKIVASVRLARSTPYEGERENALTSAKRLIEPHRPDLADNDYLLTLRSNSRGPELPMIRGVNLRSQGLASRGTPPERPRVSRGDRFHSRLLERLGKYDVKEQDLMIDGKYGRVMFMLLSPQDPLSVEEMLEIIDNSDEETDIGFSSRIPLSEMLPEPLTDQDKEVLKEIIKESAKIAAQSGWGIQAIEGHRVKKINGAVHEEIVDVLVDEVDLAMIRAMGAPTYERLASIHAVWARTVNRLNKMFGSYEEDDSSSSLPGARNKVGADLQGQGGAYEKFLQDGSPRQNGGSFGFYDARGNLVMSVDAQLDELYRRERLGQKINPAFLIRRLGRRGSLKVDRTNTNDAILEAIFEAVGVSDYSIIRTNEFVEEGSLTDGKPRSLTIMRLHLADMRKDAQMMQFAPTPAGRHMENMVSMEIKRVESHIQMYEKLGERFAHLLRESEGLSKTEAAERFKQLANTATRTSSVFQNGTPASETSTLTMFEVALSAFMSMRLGSRNLPRITDESPLTNGVHEMGHFLFGQAFTRHGEFMSNFWSYATMGPEFWRDFIQTQMNQSNFFDRMTIEEGMGLRWTREQRELFDSLSKETKMLLEDIGLVTTKMTPAGNGKSHAKRSDMDRFLNDIIRNVQEDPTTSEIEKAEIIAGLNKTRLYEEQALADGDKEALRKAMEQDLTPEVLRALRLDPLNEDDPHISFIFTTTPWNQYVRIEPSDIGWQRTQASNSSLRSSSAPTKRGPKAYRGDDEQIIKLAEEGLTIREISERIGISYKNALNKILRLRKEGKIGEVRKAKSPDSLVRNRRISKKARYNAYFNYHQNLLNGMSRGEAVAVFLFQVKDEDFRVTSERGTSETRKRRVLELLELLEGINEGIPREAIAAKGPKKNENEYILINEMKLFGFSVRETADILGMGTTSVNKYRQVHYDAYRGSQEPRAPRSSGSLRSGGRLFFETGRERPKGISTDSGVYPDRITDEMRDSQEREGNKVLRRLLDRLREFNESIESSEDKTAFRAIKAYFFDGFKPINSVLRTIADPNATEANKLLAIQALTQGKTPLDSDYSPTPLTSPIRQIQEAIEQSLDLDDAIDALDNIMALVPPLEEEIIVYRGLSKYPKNLGDDPAELSFVQQIARLGEGAVFTDAGFISTSTVLSNADGFSSRPHAKFTQLEPGLTEDDLFDNRVAKGLDGYVRGRVQPILKIIVPKGARVYAPSNNISPQEEAEVLLPRGTKFRVKSIDDSFITVEVIPSDPSGPVLSPRVLKEADDASRRVDRIKAVQLQSAGTLRSTGEPSRRDISLSDPVKSELRDVGFRAELARASLEGVEITIKKESEFSTQEFDEISLLLDGTDTKLDRALEMLEDKRLALQEAYYRLESLQEAGKLARRDAWKLGDIEERLEDLDRQEEIINRGMEANRLARLMMRNLQANSARPRGDQYDNKYVIVRKADGTLAGMTMWGFLGVDVTFEAPGIPRQTDATSLPPEDRITGRMVYIDYLVSFQNVEGMGSFLFQKVLEDSAGRGAKKVFLETTDSSMPYWERIGFTPRGDGSVWSSRYHELVGSIDEMHEQTLRSRREMEQTVNG